MQIQLKEWKISEGYELSISKEEVNVPGYLLKCFPHPYTDEDALNFVHFCQGFTGNDLLFSITVDGKAAGGANIGFEEDAFVKTARIGYWIAEHYQGVGMAAWAVEKLTEIAFREYDVLKVNAGLIAEHIRSHRVIRKNGPSIDAILHQYVQKYGKVLELRRYTVLRGETRVGS